MIVGIGIYLAIGAVLSWPFYKLTFGASWKLIPLCMVAWFPLLVWIAVSMVVDLVRGDRHW